MFTAAGKSAAVSAANYIEEVFSTYLYTGTGAAQSISNGIGLGNSAANNSSISLNASTPSYLTFSSQVNLSGNFCIQAWVYPTSLTGTRLLFSSTSDNNVQMPRIQENGGIYCYVNGTEITSGATASALQANVWTHLAMTRSGSTFRIFVNGTLYATATYSGTFNIGVLGVFFFNGSLFGTPYAFGGNISNAQIVSGSAIYTTDFTPPQNTLIGGSVLLGAGATPLADTSGTGKTVTQFGSPAASSSGPWAVGGNYGGLVWCKSRTQATSHGLFDTARGANQRLSSNGTGASANDTSSLTSFNSNGFSLGSDPAGTCNTNTDNYASWTFRKQAKFFDVVTYTGDGTNPRTISHNLGSTPGFIIIKATSTTGDWSCYHRSLGVAGGYITLNGTAAASGTAFATPINSTVFSIENSSPSSMNTNGVTYVAYLFAHDAGGFGATGTDNVISCGSYTGDGANPGPTITLGYEPQWVLIKNISVSGWDWYIGDNMRGIPFQSNAVGTPIQTLRPNLANAEAGQLGMNILATGFQPTSVSAGINGAGNTYIYIAIRRGPMKTPTSGTSVFSPVLVSQTETQQTSGGTFPPDFVFMNSTNGTSRIAYVNQIADRLRGLGVPSDTFSTTTDGLTLTTSDTTADDASNSYIQLKANGIDITRGSGWNATTFGNFIYYLMRRSPGFLDVVCYLGNGTARSVNHNLGVVPEFLMVKRRNSTGDWIGWTTYATPNQNAYYFGFNANSPWRTLGDVYWGAAQFGTPNMTSTTFSLGTFVDVNASGGTYVAYLFASVAGVSKVGTYTGNGSSQTINCGFANGARFILIKRLDVAGAWNVWDSARGIVPGNDPYFFLNNTAVQTTSNDSVDTDSSGFVVNQLAASDINVSSSPYFFLAIA